MKDGTPDGDDELDRELNEGLVALLVQDFANEKPEQARATLGILASLLRFDRLPKSGRIYLADKLQAIADGGDPTRILLPRNKKAPAVDPRKLLAEVLQEDTRGWGDMAQIHKRVGDRNGLDAGTVANLASKRRRDVRQGFAVAINHGFSRTMVIDELARRLDQPAEIVEMLLKPRRSG